jgi:hypothetical protein
MALFQYICKHAAAAILKGQKSLEPPRKIIKCWWCVVQFLETLPLTHWELGLKKPGQSKESLYNLSDSLREQYSNLSSRGMFISRKKGSVVLVQFLVLYLSSTQTYNMENTIDLRKTAENIIGKFSKKHSSQHIIPVRENGSFIVGAIST